MSILKKIRGFFEAKKETPKVEIYKDFKISPDPIKESTHFRVSAHLEKNIDGEIYSHHLIRADTLGSYEQAYEASILKAKAVIDQMGDRLFNRS